MPRLFILCLVWYVLPAFGQGHLSIEHGLSQSMIFDLCQTSDGFLWAATKDGLNRYDGYNFKVYNHNPFDSFSIAENTMVSLKEDSRGWLWIGLDSKGLDVLEPKTERFYHFPLSGASKSQVRSFETRHVVEDEDGNIYAVHGGSGLLLFRIPEAWSQTLPAQANLQDYLQPEIYPYALFRHPSQGIANDLLGVEPVARDRVWVYTDVGVFLLNPETGVIQHTEELTEVSFPEKWGATPYSLFWFDGVRVREMYKQKESNLTLKRAIPDVNGGYWIGIGQTLWYVQPGQEPDWSNPTFELDAQPTSIATDCSGNIWIGTDGYGIRRMNPRGALFHAGADRETIWGLWRDHQGRYFAKVINDIFPYDPVLRTLGKTRAFPDAPARVLDLLITPENEYWLLGREHEDVLPSKLCRHLPETGQTDCYSMSKLKLWVFLHSKLLRTQGGDLWITGVDCQLARFNPPTQSFRYYEYGQLFEGEYGQVRPYALAEDGHGNLWIGTQRGLVHGVLSGDSLRCTLIRVEPDNPKGLNNNFIASLLPDPEYPKDILWIGTKGGGINRLHIPSGHIQHISQKEGMPDQVVYGILPGDGPELWCSTNRGLGRIKLRNFSAERESSIERITHFTKAQGLQDNEFNTQAYYKAANGELLFGGINGLNRFFPIEVVPDTSASPLLLVNLQVNYAPWEPEQSAPQSVTYLRSMRLQHNQNNLSFEFALLDFSDPGKNRYRYRLNGLDKDWVEMGTHRFAYFTNLAPGSYLLEAQGSNGEGAWQALEQPVSIVIRPPWWLSEVALLVYAGGLIFLGWWLYQFQLRRLKLRQQLEFEHRETERIRALEAMKTTFFTNVTHEFRTPLTLILEPARRILQNTNNTDILTNARHIETNSHRLLSLVNQLMDLAKIESGSMRIDLRRDNFLATLQKVVDTFLPLAEERDITIELQATSPLNDFDFDSERVSLILNNLLSNALKFTPRGGQVIVRTAFDANQLRVVVQDTGIGISPELLPRIFERFFQVESNSEASGTGIGLTLSRDLAELMGGSLQAESTPGHGTTFTFSLPVLHMAHTSSDIPKSEKYTEPSVTRSPEPANLDSAIVLLIEDNADMREFIRAAIPAPWEVVEAANGTEGIQKAREIVPDLIISDLMMPGKDGYEVCAILKSEELTAHIPIILLTGKTTMESKLKGLRTGADDYLVKPFHTAELLVRVENLIESRKMLRARFSSQTETELNAQLAPPDRDFLNRLLELLNEHLANENLTVEEVARNLFISRVQLHRKLKAIADKNATEFIRDYRLERAMVMLQNREGLVYEVAYRVGFRNEKYFSRAFKEKFGVSPSQMV